MKRWSNILLGSMLCALVLSGCAVKKEQVASDQVQANATNKESDRTEEQIVKSDEADKNNVDSAQTPENMDKTNTDGAAKETDIVSPKGINYSTVEGLKLEPGTYIAFVENDAKSKYWSTVTAGAKQAVSDLNKVLGYSGGDKIKLTVDAPDSEKEVASQISMIDEVLDSNPSAVCMSVIDSSSGKAQLDMADENGIPVIGLDSGVEGDPFNTVVATDNFAAGALAARELSQLIGDAGQIAIMEHNHDSKSGADRTAGFVNEIESNHPNINIVNITDMDKKEIGIPEMTASVLNVFPDIKAYFGTNETMTNGILEALKTSGRTDIQVAGFDSGSKQIEAIKNGSQAGAVTQNPYGLGYASVVAAAREILGLENDPYINTGFLWVTKENIEDENVKAMLYE